MEEIINQLEGTGVALVTPFNNKGSIDYEGLEKLIHYVSENVNYLVILGTTGESATLNEEEKVAVLDFVKKKNYKNLPLILGMGGNNTQYVLNKIENTDFKGIDGILSVCPYYNKPSQKGIFNHFTAIAEKSPVPVVLYNVPGRTGSNMQAPTTVKLAENKNIVGIKEASNNFGQCAEIMRTKPGNFLLISGDDLFTLPVMATGGSGVISVLANGLPGTFSEMVNAALEGNYQKASGILMRILEINKYMYEESNPVGIKELLRQKNVCGNFVRQPLEPASQELSDNIRKGIEIAGF